MYVCMYVCMYVYIYKLGMYNSWIPTGQFVTVLMAYLLRGFT